MPEQRKKKTRRPSGPARPSTERGRAASRLRLVVENLLVLAVLAQAWALQKWNEDLYYRSVQEDEYLEWATFWAFMAAAALSFAVAWRQRRSGLKVPWFLLGVGLFCVFVAMEEISWGQRVFAYRPPSYFLEHNFQQELNLHNVVSTSWRKLALMGVILGYGVALPLLLAALPPLRKLAARLGVLASPLGLAPAFLATHIAYQTYPWSFTGEVVELMLGLGFLFAATELLLAQGAARPRSAVALSVAPWAAVIVLGFLTAGVSRWMWQARPEAIEGVRTEARALADDFLDRVGRRCGIHKRVYSFMEKYEEEGLLEGAFAALQAQGLPEERAEFFLDPWNSPYWIRYKCKKRPRIERGFVYSFGPNRRRDSTDWEILGDDVGATFHAVGDLPGDS